MIRLNEEQKAARSLQVVNIILAVIAFIPALFCWSFTFAEPSELGKEYPLFICSSVLLFVFYGYTMFYPRIHLSGNYSRSTSYRYWLIVLITNLLTGFLFVCVSCWKIAIIPAIPFLIALDGLISHLELNAKKTGADEKIK